MYVQRVTAAYPDLPIVTACLHTAERQFNDILIVNEAVVFRFPRSPRVAATLAAEAALLTQLQERLPLPIPNPIYHMRDLLNRQHIHEGDVGTGCAGIKRRRCAYRTPPPTAGMLRGDGVEAKALATSGVISPSSA